MPWNSELPTEDGIYWIKPPILGSKGRYWQPSLRDIRLNGSGIHRGMGIIVYPIGADNEGIIVSEKDGYLFSEKVEVPD